jgi:hypothetical protein
MILLEMGSEARVNIIITIAGKSWEVVLWLWCDVMCVINNNNKAMNA